LVEKEMKKKVVVGLDQDVPLLLSPILRLRHNTIFCALLSPPRLPNPSRKSIEYSVNLVLKKVEELKGSKHFSFPVGIHILELLRAASRLG
jgi:hypothetical protein